MQPPHLTASCLALSLELSSTCYHTTHWSVIQPHTGSHTPHCRQLSTLHHITSRIMLSTTPFSVLLYLRSVIPDIRLPCSTVGHCLTGILMPVIAVTELFLLHVLPVLSVCQVPDNGTHTSTHLFCTAANRYNNT